MTKPSARNPNRSGILTPKIIVTLIVSFRLFPVGKSENAVTKCCPSGQLFSASKNLTCTASENWGRELYPLSRGHHERFTCGDNDDLTITGLNDFNDSAIIAPACLDFSTQERNVPSIFQCRPRSGPGGESDYVSLPVPRLSNVRICCGPTESYDSRLRQCVARRRKVDFTKLFGFADGTFNFVSIDRGAPKCQHAILHYVVNITENAPRALADGTFEMVVASKNGGITIVANEENSCLDPDDAKPDMMAVRVCSGPDYCEKNACVRKCCPEGQTYSHKMCHEIPSNASPVNFHGLLLNTSIERGLAESAEYLTASDYGLLIGRSCEHGMFVVHEDEGWHMNSNGDVSVPRYRIYDHDDYCVEVFYPVDGSTPTINPCVCFDSPNPLGSSAIRFSVNGVLELTSCTFLVVTLLVYICLPTLRNLHGKTVMCHVGSMIVAYGSLSVNALQFIDTEGQFMTTDVCTFLGYLTVLSWMAAFSWLNVMCFDIWWTFGGLAGAARSGGRSRAYRKRFFMYSLYAWGWPLAITALTATIDFAKSVPWKLRPNIGIETCWFPDDASSYGKIVFFLIPLTVQLFVNVVFFVLTAMHCSRVKAEIAKFTTTAADPRAREFHADRTKLVMNVKLFVVMGMSWTFELISAVVDFYAMDLGWHPEFFYFSDVVNCLQGVLIFVLFVMKRQVYRALRRRLSGRIGNKSGSNGVEGLQAPFTVRKSGSSSTIVSNFVVSNAP